MAVALLADFNINGESRDYSVLTLAINETLMTRIERIKTDHFRLLPALIRLIRIISVLLTRIPV